MNGGTIATRSARVEVRLGHVHLRVSDLDRSAAFYRDVVGLDITLEGRGHGLPMVLLAASGYHHHIALNTFDSAGASAPPPGHTGLFHVAFLYPDRASLARSARRALAHGVTIGSGRDHGGTVSMYLKDPDLNGVELYYDRPRDHWFAADGRLIVRNDRFDPVEWLAACEEPSMVTTE